MRPRLRTLTLASVVALGGVLGAGSGDAKAQVYVNTPGLSVAVGRPAVVAPYAAFGYPVVPVPVAPVAPVYAVRPVVSPYVLARRPAYYGPPRAYYGPRAYGPRYYGYRRW